MVPDRMMNVREMKSMEVIEDLCCGHLEGTPGNKHGNEVMDT